MQRCWMLVSMALAGACTEPNPAFDPDPYLPGECRAGAEVTEVFDAFERPEKLEVLFVVDASGDPQDLQMMLADSLLPFLKVLEGSGPHTRAAVATTSLADGAKLARPGRVAEGCDTNDVIVAQSSSPNFVKAVRCNIVQGASDEDRFDQPLGVIDAMLTEDAEGDFLRDDARLLVIVATKDDDCTSSQPLTGAPRDVCPGASALADVGELVGGWRDARVTADSIALAVFGGPPSDEEREDRPVCSSSVGSVYPANRLYAAAGVLGEHGFFFGACTDDVSPPLLTIADRFISRGTTTFCPEAPLVHEPLAVVTSTEDEQTSVPLGDEGFVYMGATSTCQNGAIRFATDALSGVDEVAVEYCTISVPGTGE